MKIETTSDWLALIALFVSIVTVPLAAWLSHWLAIRQYKTEQADAKAEAWYQAKVRFEKDVELYSEIYWTIAMHDHQIDLNQTTETNDPTILQAILQRLYEYRIHERIADTVTRLRELGFYEFRFFSDICKSEGGEWLRFMPYSEC